MSERDFVMYLWQTSTLKAHLHSIYSGYTDMSGDSGGLSAYYNLGRYDLSVEEGLWGPRWRSRGGRVRGGLYLGLWSAVPCGCG